MEPNEHQRHVTEEMGLHHNEVETRSTCVLVMETT